MTTNNINDNTTSKNLQPSTKFSFRLSEEQISLAKTVFDVFDEDGDGLIDRKCFPIALRATGLVVSEREVQELLDEVDPDKSGFMGDFYVQVARRFRDQGEIEKSICDSLNILSFSSSSESNGIGIGGDNNSNRVININTFKTSLMDPQGEPLTINDTLLFSQTIPKECLLTSGKDGDIDYQSFENLLLLFHRTTTTGGIEEKRRNSSIHHYHHKESYSNK